MGCVCLAHVERVQQQRPCAAQSGTGTEDVCRGDYYGLPLQFQLRNTPEHGHPMGQRWHIVCVGPESHCAGGCLQTPLDM